MSNKDKIFISKTIEKLKTIARDNAVRMPSNDDGFQVTICPNEIKLATGRVRMKTSVLDKYKNEFEEAGFIPKESQDKCINIFVPPMLAIKEKYNLSEINERIDIIKEIEISTK